MKRIVCNIQPDPKPQFDIEDILEDDFELSGGVVRDYDKIEYITSQIKKWKGNRAKKNALKTKANQLISNYNTIRGFKCFPLIK